MIRARQILSAFAVVIGLVMVAPAHAQVMPSQGLDFGWFASKSERAQRDACRRNLPECRAAVRAQMAVEESITVIVPWAGLGFAILGVLLWLRAQEKKRDKAKLLARAHHTPSAQKRADQAREAKAKKQADEDSDEML